MQLDFFLIPHTHINIKNKIIKQLEENRISSLPQE